VRSIGEAFMHVASEFYVYAPMAYGAARSPVIPRGQDSFKTFESKSTKADVKKHLVEGIRVHEADDWRNRSRKSHRNAEAVRRRSHDHRDVLRDDG
jgi:hypothetical protein